MRQRLPMITFFVATSVALLILHSLSQAQSVRLPAFEVTDQSGTLVGAFFSANNTVSAPGENYVRVLRRDTMTVPNENYTIYVGPNHIQGVTEDDVFYSSSDCTGTAYVPAPSTLDDLSGLRGSVYVVGRNAGAGDEDSLILRGSGAGADNSGSMLSRYRTDVNDGPTCFSGGSTFPTASPTVIATQVDDLSGLTRPFKVK